MNEEPVVEEIHRVRAEIAAEFDGDVHKLFEYLRERERVGNGTVVTLEPNEPEAIKTAR